jgi:hypothetical protein
MYSYAMAEWSVAYTSDGNWRVVLSLRKFESPFYSTIGANAKAQSYAGQQRVVCSPRFPDNLMSVNVFAMSASW